MSYFWKYFCETLGFLIDDVAEIYHGIKGIIIPIFLGIMVITGSTAFVTIIVHYCGSTILEPGFYYVTYTFFVQIGVCALYWIATGAKRAKRRMR